MALYKVIASDKNDQNDEGEVIHNEIGGRFLFSFLKDSSFWKMIFTLFMIIPIHTCTGIALVITRARRPQTPSLPDFIHDYYHYQNFELFINLLMLASMVTELTFILFDKRRVVIIRRTIAAYEFLCVLRLLTMTVTSLPDPSPMCPVTHETKIELTIANVAKELFGGTTCGDMIFSGHTMGFVIPALVHTTYFGKKIAAIYWIVALIGAFLLILTRMHYTVDVLLTFVIAPPYFYLYKLVSENPSFATYLPWFLSKYFNIMEWPDVDGPTFDLTV